MLTIGAARPRDARSIRVYRFVVVERVELDIETYSQCFVSECVVEDQPCIASYQGLGSHDIQAGTGPFVDVAAASLVLLSDS